jgi:hypothetical protein
VTPGAGARPIVDQVEPLREVGAGERDEDGTLAGFESVQLLAHAELVDDAVELLAQRRIAALTELVEAHARTPRGNPNELPRDLKARVGYARRS